jgi:hypothetical protein
MSTQEERKDVLVESVKEAGRMALLGVVGYLLSAGVLESILNVVFGVSLSMEVKLMIAGFITTALKSADKWLHETAKNQPVKTRKEGLLGEKGLTGF